jgi:hypothetical protein
MIVPPPDDGKLAEICRALRHDFLTASDRVTAECDAIPGTIASLRLCICIDGTPWFDETAMMVPGEWHLRLSALISDAQDEVVMALGVPWRERPGYARPLIPHVLRHTGCLTWWDFVSRTPVVCIGSL